MTEKYRQEEVVEVVRKLIKSEGLVDIDLHIANHRFTVKVVHSDDVYEIDINEIENCFYKSIPPKRLSVTLNGELMYDEILDFNLGASLYNDAYEVWNNAASMLAKQLKSDIEDKIRKQQKIDDFLAKLS